MHYGNCKLSDEGAKSRLSGKAAIKNENMFAVLMEATKYCSLGQLTAAMFEVGGQYRRNM
jgi:isobutyryl-CoA mutase